MLFDGNMRFLVQLEPLLFRIFLFVLFFIPSHGIFSLVWMVQIIWKKVAQLISIQSFIRWSILVLVKKSINSSWRPNLSIAMPKIKVMKYNQFMMTALGVYPRSSSSSSLSNYLHLLSPYLVIISMILCISSAFLFIYRGSIHLTHIIEALIVVFGAPQPLFAYINLRWKMKRVAEVNEKLQAVIDQGIVNFVFSGVWMMRNFNCFSPFLQLTQKM